ncbi:hypothetical protein BHM03_00038639 [Ensete ventricosum]|nr:hypothetical protein BHM03_00038639 [Ensete ventricosum]
MLLHPHVLRTSRPHPEGRQRIVIPETTRGTNRPMPRTWTTEEEPTHAGGLDPHRPPRVPTEEASTMIPTLNRYWRLFNDPGLAPLDPILSPIMPGLGPPGVTTKAFLGLTQQVRTLTGMIQSIVPYIPQLAQAPTHQHPYIPRQTMQQEAPQSRSSQGERLRGSAPHPRSKPRSRSLSESTAKPLSRCYASPARAGCCFLKLYQLVRQRVRAQLHSKFLPEADGCLTARPHTRKRRATRPIRQQILDRDPKDARYSSYYGNPSILDRTSTLTILLVVDRETPVHSARDVTTGEPVCSSRVIGGQEAGRSQETPR